MPMKCFRFTIMYRIHKIRAQILYIKQDHYNESILLTPWSQPSLTLLNLRLLSSNPSFSLFRYTCILELCLFVSLNNHINKWYHSICIIFQLALYHSTYVWKLSVFQCIVSVHSFSLLCVILLAGYTMVYSSLPIQKDIMWLPWNLLWSNKFIFLPKPVWAEFSVTGKGSHKCI